MKKLLFVFPILVLLTVACNSSKQTSTQTPIVQNVNSTSAPNSIVENQTQYNLTFSKDSKSLDISLNGKILKHIAINNLPKPFNTTTQREADYIFDFTNNSQATLDKARNRIYFIISNLATAGNVNSQKAIFAYDFITDKVFLISERGYTNGGGPIVLSPDYRYMVFSEGSHGGMCYNFGGFVVLDLTNNKDKVKIFPEKNQVGFIAFNKWVDNTSFSYQVQVFESGKQCQDNQGDDSKAPVKQKIYIIK